MEKIIVSPKIEILDPNEVSVAYSLITTVLIIGETLEIFQSSELFLERLGYVSNPFNPPDLYLGSFLHGSSKDAILRICSPELKTETRVEIENVGFRRADGGLEHFDVTAIKLRSGHFMLGLERTKSGRDLMTGFYNLNAFLMLGDQVIDILYREAIESRKYHYSKKPENLVFLMFDMDAFKTRINDKYGPAEGDRAIITVAKAIATFFRRATEYKGRLGGDEFGVVLWKDYPIGIFEAADREISKIVNQDWGADGELSFTMGVAIFNPNMGNEVSLPTMSGLRVVAAAMIDRLKKEKGIKR